MTPAFSSTVTCKTYSVINHSPKPLTCISDEVIYLITCARCKVQYVGETSRELSQRNNNHRSTFRNKYHTLLAEHFSGEGACNIEHCLIQPIEKIISEGNRDIRKLRLEREAFWIKELRTLTPYGLNDKLGSQNWRHRWRDDIAGRCFNSLATTRGSRGSRGNSVSGQDNIWFLKALESSYDNLNNWRNAARIKVNSVSIVRLKEMAWFYANLSNDWSCNTPREIINLMTDMINCRLFESNQKDKDAKKYSENYFKIQFQAKEIEKIHISKIFHKHANLIPSKFSTREPPKVIFSRTKNLGSVFFNYKTTVANADKVTQVCQCLNSDFRDPFHGHIVTGDLRVIENPKIRQLLSKGTNYREPRRVNWKLFLPYFTNCLKNLIETWSIQENAKQDSLSDWYTNVLKDVKERINTLKKTNFRYGIRNCVTDKLKDTIEDLKDRFVFVPTDKASKNFGVVCKKFYVEISQKELGLSRKLRNTSSNPTYEIVSKDINSVISEHVAYMKLQNIPATIPPSLPFLYWIPKFHKKPHSKQRFIAASRVCSTKPLSKILTYCLKLVEDHHRTRSRFYEISHGINPMWIIHNSSSVFKRFSFFNQKKECRNVRTYDFSTLYTSIPHQQLKTRISTLVKQAFDDGKHNFISLGKFQAKWSNNPRDSTFALSCQSVCFLLEWLIDNIYVTFGDKLFRQVIGIPMGTDCAPFLANLFLFSYEYEWIDKQRSTGNLSILYRFRGCCRYIDDLLTVNNDDLMKKYMKDIYPPELILVPDETDGLSVHFLDMNILISNGVISTSIYDKRDSFSFPIVNFPDLTGNIPLKESHGVFTGECVRYARSCTFLEDFTFRTQFLVDKLKSKGFKIMGLKKTWKKFCDRHILLVSKYGSAVLKLCDSWNF